MSAGLERYVLTDRDGTRLVLPPHFRPSRSSPPQPDIELVRAYGYPDVLNTREDDAYENPADSLIQLQGALRLTTETALMGTLTDWRRHTRHTVTLAREITPGVARRSWAIQGGALTWAHPPGVDSRHADVLITLIKTLADGLDDLDPAS